jgi:hypothetical protein
MLILDAGAFIAAERGDDNVAALVKRERKHGRVPLTNGGVVAQVWRDGNGKQAPIARLLASAHVIPVDNELGRRAGQLLARTGTSDAIDASVICLAQDGDDVLTSDPADLQALARAAGVHVDLISVLARTCALNGARGPVANYATGLLAVAASGTDRPAQLQWRTAGRAWQDWTEDAARAVFRNLRCPLARRGASECHSRPKSAASSPVRMSSSRCSRAVLM